MQTLLAKVFCKQSALSFIRQLDSKKKLHRTSVAYVSNISLTDYLGSISLNRRTISQKVIRNLQRECNAVFALLERSYLPLNSSNLRIFTRRLHTSQPNNALPESNGKKPQRNNDDDDDDKISTLLAKAFFWMLTTYTFIAIISRLFPSSNQAKTITNVSWNEFVYHMLAKGEVEKVIVRPNDDIVTIVLHNGAVFKGKKVEHEIFHMTVADINRFEEKLRTAETSLGIQPKDFVLVIIDRSSDTVGKLLSTIIIGALLLSLLSLSGNIRPRISTDIFSQLGRAKFTLIDPLFGPGKGVHFSDVAGLQEAKQEVMEFVDYLKRPYHYRSFGAKVPKGALLLGPPGCGKTLLAKAVATEANVPFLYMNGSEFIEMIGGLGAARVRDLFKEGRKRLPCIIYIDEIDAIGRKRSGGATNFDGASGESEQTLNQLLVEMDGMSSTEGVIVLSSTNRADVLDRALLRPGRFDRQILIDLPNLEERKEIFEQHLKGISLEKAPKYYYRRMAHLTPGFSGADIANVCNEAALHAARYKQTVVRGSDLEYAVERLVGGTEKRSHVMSPQEKRVVAYHEAGHALVGWMLPHTDEFLKVTIVPRTNQALGFALYTPSEKRLHSKEELFERMCMGLGGRVAESLIFNRITTGAQNDLRKVTKMAYAQVRQLGMCDSVGLVSFPEKDGSKVGTRPYSKKLAALMDYEARRLVARAYLKTESVLKENHDKHKLLAETLLKRETLNYKEVEELIGRPPYGKKSSVDPEEME